MSLAPSPGLLPGGDHLTAHGIRPVPSRVSSLGHRGFARSSSLCPSKVNGVARGPVRCVLAPTPDARHAIAAAHEIGTPETCTRANIISVDLKLGVGVIGREVRAADDGRRGFFFSLGSKEYRPCVFICCRQHLDCHSNPTVEEHKPRSSFGLNSSCFGPCKFVECFDKI
jgi:hypothetical protein